MDDFPKYPTDFVAMTRPFEDEDLEKLLSQTPEEVAFTIDVLKSREVNATTAYQNLKDKISKEISDLEKIVQNKTLLGNHRSFAEIKISALESLL